RSTGDDKGGGSIAGAVEGRQPDGEIGIELAGRGDLAVDSGPDVLGGFAEVDAEFLGRRSIELEVEQQLQPVIDAVIHVRILAAIAGGAAARLRARWNGDKG